MPDFIEEVLSIEKIKLLVSELYKQRVITDTNCWTLGKIPNSCGYSILKIGGKGYKAHRLACAFYHKLDYNNKEQYACHKNKCNNKLCWNPEHLYKGDRHTNGQDSYDRPERNRRKSFFVSCACGGKLHQGRFCRTCYLKNQKEYNKTKRKKET